MMRLQSTLLACLLALIPVAAYADEEPATPPTGITPVSEMTLTRLMALHRSAVGKLDEGTLPTRVETWTYKDAGQSGTQTIVYSGNDFCEDTVLGPFHSAHGEFRGKSWEQDRNGVIRYLSGIHRRDDVNDYALAHPLLAASGVRLLGEVASPLRAYLVKVAPKNGLVEYAFFDASTYLIMRDERASWGRRVVRTYDDFRVAKGVREPWHIHESNGLPDDDRDWQMQALAIGERVEYSKLAIPPSREVLTLHGATVALPAKFSGDRIVLTMQIGPHKVNMLLDSGASNILINRDVADATGVQSFGKRTEVTAGAYLASDALIPKIDFGVATMHNVSAATAPYSEWSYGDIPIAGLLGYDFIAGSVIHVDYYHETVTAIAPASFTPPTGAIALPIRLDDGVPVIEAKIGSAKARNFVIDTGADRSMIFSGFANAHAADVTDQGLGDEITASQPFINNIHGVGGKVRARPVQVSSLSFSTIRLPNWLFYVSQDAASFEGDDYDGLIGQDVLRNFELYFDYAHMMLYLLPNERYRQRWSG